MTMVVTGDIMNVVEYYEKYKNEVPWPTDGVCQVIKANELMMHLDCVNCSEFFTEDGIGGTVRSCTAIRPFKRAA